MRISRRPAAASRAALLLAASFAAASLLVVAEPLGAPAASATLLDDGRIIVIPVPDSGGPSTWTQDSVLTSAVSGVFTIPSDWREVRYRVSGASGGSGVDGGAGGLPALIEGEVPAGVTEIRWGRGERGGSGADPREAGDTSYPGGTGMADRFEPAGGGGQGDDVGTAGGGGGGLSYLGARVSGTEAWAFLAVAAGGGGGAGTMPMGLCVGAPGGAGDQPGADAVGHTVSFPGGSAVYCQHAPGGASGLAFASPVLSRSRGADGDISPGAGGGGAGAYAGAGGSVTAGLRIPIVGGTEGGGAGGGGGGGSLVLGDPDHVRSTAAADRRGKDGLVSLSYYRTHELSLLPQPLGTELRAGATLEFDFQVMVHVNAPIDEVERDGIVSVTLDGEPVRSPRTGSIVTGSLAAGLAVVLPPSPAGPQELCFSYQPTSPKLESSAPVCVEVEIEPTSLDTVLAFASELSVGTGENPLCAEGCLRLPAATNGPWLHPRVLDHADYDLDGEAPLGETSVELLWTDLTAGTSGTAALGDLERATEGGLVIGGPPARLPRVAGGWPYEYMRFLPEGAAPQVGHVYEIRARWGGTELFDLADSPPLRLEAVASPTVLTVTGLTAPLTAGRSPVTAVAASGSSHPNVPVCCGLFGFTPPPVAVSGAFTAVLSQDGATLASRSATGSSASWADWPRLAAGPYELTVEFASAEARRLDRTESVAFEVVRNATETSLDIDPESAPYGADRRLTATVTAPGSTAESAPRGRVEFSYLSAGGRIVLGDAELGEDGVALLELDADAVAGLLPMSYSIRADYEGDDAHDPSTRSEALHSRPLAPSFTSPDLASLVAGAEAAIEVSASGMPIPSFEAVGLPPGMVLTDRADGTAVISGSSLELGTHVVYLRASNDETGETDALQTLLVTITPPGLTLPSELPPPAAGALVGVPAETAPLASFEVSASGFAPHAPVVFGIYSTPRTLSTATADAAGEASATVTIPWDLRGAHTVVAFAVDPGLEPRMLTADTRIVLPPVGLALTGSIVSGAGLLAAGMLGGVLAAAGALLVRFRTRATRP